MTHATFAVLNYHLVGYRRGWRETVFSSFAIPILMFVGLGMAVASVLDSGVEARLGAGYLSYIAPGMLAFAGMQIAMLEGGFQVQSCMAWDRIYHGMAAAPPRVIDIISGHLVYLSLRVLITAGSFLVVMVPFGAVRSVGAALTPFVAALVALAIATPMFAYAASVTGPYLMAVVRFTTLPMTFFSGVFFPVELLPGVLQGLAYPLPLWHGAELCRALTLGNDTAWPAVAHVGVLLAWFAGGFVVAHARFVRGLSH